MKTRSEIAEQVSKNEETVRLFKDGNQMCALIGDNIQEGPCGFGETVGDALRELAQTCDCKEFVHEPAAPVSPPELPYCFICEGRHATRDCGEVAPVSPPQQAENTCVEVKVTPLECLLKLAQLMTKETLSEDEAFDYSAMLTHVYAWSAEQVGEVSPVSPPQCKICGKFEGDLIHAKDEKGIFTAFGHRSHAFEVAPVSPKLPRHSCHITEQGHLLEPCDACAKEKADMATGKFTADPSNPKQLECRCWCGRECGCGCHDGTPEREECPLSPEPPRARYCKKCGGAEGYVGHDPHGTQYTHGFIPREAQPASATTDPLMSAEQYEIVWRKAKGLSQLLGLRRSEWLQFALSYAEYWAAQSLSAQTPPQIRGKELYRTNRFALRCPHCDKQGTNLPGAGGNERCFHCSECGFAECEWCSPAHEIGFEAAQTPPDKEEV